VNGWDTADYGSPRYVLDLLRRHSFTGAFCHPKYGGNRPVQNSIVSGTAGIFRGRSRLSFWQMSQIWGGEGRPCQRSDCRFSKELPASGNEASERLVSRAGAAHLR